MKPMAFRRKRYGWVPVVLISTAGALGLVAIIPSPHYRFLPLFLFAFGVVVLFIGIATDRNTLRSLQGLAGALLLGGIFVWLFQQILKSLAAG